MKKFEVVVEYSISLYGTQVIEVEAESEEQARQLGKEEFDEEQAVQSRLEALSDDEHWWVNIIHVEPLERK